MVLPVQRVNATEDDDRCHGEGAIAAGGVIRPVRADKRVDEQETADERQRIEEEEQVHVAVVSCNLHDCSRSEQRDECGHRSPDVRIEARGYDFLRDFRTEDGRDVERDEVDLPPEVRHAVRAREERG